MKGLLDYGRALLAALLLHGALALGLNAAVRFGAPKPTAEEPISVHVLLLPAQEPEGEGLRLLQPRPKRAAAEAMKLPPPSAQPEAQPPSPASQDPGENSEAAQAEAAEPEAPERLVSARFQPQPTGTAAAAPISPIFSRDALTEARPLSVIDPSFPLGSRIRGEQGDVRLQVWISADGRLEKTQILKTSGYPALDESAERAVKKTRFAPRRVNGSPVSSTLTITVRFRLEEQSP